MPSCATRSRSKAVRAAASASRKPGRPATQRSASAVAAAAAGPPAPAPWQRPPAARAAVSRASCARPRPTANRFASASQRRGHHRPVTRGLLGLRLQSRELLLEQQPALLRPRQVGFRRPQPHLRLGPARMQPGDPGRFLQHAAAFFRVGVHQGADPALAYHRRGSRPAGEVRKQGLHVARPRFTPIDAVGATGAALDAPHHLNLGLSGKGRRQAALVVLDGDGHFGQVAAGPGAGAGEDHVVHLAAAQAAGVGLAHRPAQRLGHVAFAAAVGPDDAGQAGQDLDRGGVGEALEPRDPEPDEACTHAGLSPVALSMAWRKAG